MANIVKHRFASAKSDGVDLTQVQPSHWNDGHVFTGGVAGDVLTRDPTDASFGAKWGGAAGIWTETPFSAANFNAASGGIWTVSAGNVIVNRYTVNNKTMIWAVHIQGSSLGGSASAQLLLTNPYGINCRPNYGCATGQFVAGASNLYGFAYSNGVVTVVQPHPFGVISAGSLTVVFTITMELA